MTLFESLRRLLLGASLDGQSRDPIAEEADGSYDSTSGVEVEDTGRTQGAPEAPQNASDDADGTDTTVYAFDAPSVDSGPPRAAEWPTGLDPGADRRAIFRRSHAGRIRRAQARLEPTPAAVERFHLVTGDYYLDRPSDEQRSLTAAWLRECAQWADPNFRPERRPIR